MGMVLTLYLISANVYNAVEGPDNRGFSYIELWYIGAQFPILLAICEYGVILYMKKNEKKRDNQNQALNLDKSVLSLDERIKKLDSVTMKTSFIYFSLFSSLYWIILTTKAQ